MNGQVCLTPMVCSPPRAHCGAHRRRGIGTRHAGLRHGQHVRADSEVTDSRDAHRVRRDGVSHGILEQTARRRRQRAARGDMRRDLLHRERPCVVRHFVERGRQEVCRSIVGGAEHEIGASRWCACRGAAHVEHTVHVETRLVGRRRTPRQRDTRPLASDPACSRHRRSALRQRPRRTARVCRSSPVGSPFPRRRRRRWFRSLAA